MKTLKELDDALIAMILETNGLPEKLQAWQTEVGDMLATRDPTPEEAAPFFERWQRILSENKRLLEEHQEHLKSKLKIGELDTSTIKKIKAYQDSINRD